MPKFNVHVFAVARVKFEGIEAASQVEAIQRIDEGDLYEILRQSEPEVEFGEEISHYLVDETNASGKVLPDFTTFYDQDGQTTLDSQGRTKVQAQRDEFLAFIQKIANMARDGDRRDGYEGEYRAEDDDNRETLCGLIDEARKLII